MSIFLKEPRKPVDMKEPIVMKRGATIRDLCLKIHRDFVDKFKFAKVKGPSAKFDWQILSLGHVLKDGDAVELHLR